MEATSITRRQDGIFELATQALHEKMEEAGRQIYDSLADGAVHAATEVARNLSTWFEETIWTAYLTYLFQCREILVVASGSWRPQSPPFCLLSGNLDHAARHWFS